MANQLTLNNTALEEIKVLAASLPTANTIELDTTLTKANMAADAKATGDAIANKAPAIHADQHSWNDTLTWDGDETGRTTAVISTDPDGWIHKVVLLSEKVPTTADLANGYFITAHNAETGHQEKNEHSLDDVGVNSDGAMMLPDGGYIFIIPTDNYVYKEFHSGFTFPKAGVYWMYSVYDGVVSYSIEGFTIPGYNFIKSTDPITPERIGAAPSYHASESAEHGVGTDKKYGHLKIADFGDVFTGGEENLLDIAIGLPTGDLMVDLKPYALGAYTGYECLNYLATYVNDHDVLVTEHNKSIRNLQQQTLKQADRQSIITDALAALAGADPSNANAAVIETLSGRTGNLETKFRNMAEDIAWLQRDVDNFETSFIILHHPLPAPEDPEKMSFVYTSWMSNGDDSKWYDDITLMSPTGDVYAGRMIDGEPSQYTREKLATEKYVQNAMILTSPNGNRFRITVNDDGTLSTTPVT